MAPGPDFTQVAEESAPLNRSQRQWRQSKNAFSTQGGLPLVKAQLFSQALELEFQPCLCPHSLFVLEAKFIYNLND